MEDIKFTFPSCSPMRTTTKQELLDSIREAFKRKELIRLVPAKKQRAAMEQLITQRCTYLRPLKDTKEYSFYAIARDLNLLSKLFDEVVYIVGRTLESNVKRTDQ